MSLGETVSIWSARRKDGDLYCGIRLGALRNSVLQTQPKSVTVELVGGETYKVTLAASFWHKCPEFRHPSVAAWLKAQHLLPWPERQPPHFRFERVADDRLRILPGNVRP